MGWLSDFCSGVCSIVSDRASGIGGIIGGIATGIASIVQTLPPLMEPWILINIIIEVIKVVAEILGLKDAEETPEELGMKAEKANKKPEDFDDYQQYIEYLRNEIEIDKKELENLSAEKKAAYGLIGSSIYIKGIEEKTKTVLPPEFWVEMGKQHMKAEDVTRLIENSKAEGITNMKSISDCLSGKLDRQDNARVSDIIISGIKELNPGMSEKEISEKYIEMCDKSKGIK